jgi:transcriptional regulator GlxA family with amidase domain
MTASKTMQPQEEAGLNGQIGLPHKWCAKSQALCISHAIPMSMDDKTAMGPLLLWIEKNLHEELSLPVIARQAAMSVRSLSRRFVERVGTTPAKWVAAARVRRAQLLLETTSLSVEEVAARCGFQSASVFREHFAGIVKTPPVAYRRSFGLAGHR